MIRSTGDAFLHELNKDAETLRLSYGNSLGDKIIADIYKNAEQITKNVILIDNNKKNWTLKLDNYLTSKVFGYPFMLLVLGIILWITISGANIPSDILASALFGLQEVVSRGFLSLGAPAWLHGVLVLGVFNSVAWVVSVMLPPMAIFFPLFTLLEDLGYLPRVAFNLDNLFKKAKTCGKQSLTMCMGFGCNAAGVVACRIIDSPRERLIAILTNNFVPCNGRFPILIAIGTIFGVGALASQLQALAVTGIITGVIMIGVFVTFAVSWFLSRSVLKGEASSMVLELPPYRRPKIVSVVYRSIIDRTIFVLKRAVIVAAPAGGIIWIVANTYIGEISILNHLAGWLNPFAQTIGMDGYILLAFILGLPANEIVFPILIMSYISSGTMIELESLAELQMLFINHGWTWLTAANVMLFTLLHWPCGTTLITTRKETGSKKWTLAAFIIPTTVAFTVCFILTQTVRLLGLA
ncbi:MAG: iron transporter FeoB [Gracilibacter sp. BRH_c7a]|nr:MAG: iron transporter FeoB [Gracilibacter sp. BRH_c7a]